MWRASLNPFTDLGSTGIHISTTDTSDGEDMVEGSRTVPRDTHDSTHGEWYFRPTSQDPDDHWVNGVPDLKLTFGLPISPGSYPVGDPSYPTAPKEHSQFSDRMVKSFGGL